MRIVYKWQLSIPSSGNPSPPSAIWDIKRYWPHSLHPHCSSARSRWHQEMWPACQNDFVDWSNIPWGIMQSSSSPPAATNHYHLSQAILPMLRHKTWYVHTGDSLKMVASVGFCLMWVIKIVRHLSFKGYFSAMIKILLVKHKHKYQRLTLNKYVNFVKKVIKYLYLCCYDHSCNMETAVWHEIWHIFLQIISRFAFICVLFSHVFVTNSLQCYRITGKGPLHWENI